MALVVIANFSSQPEALVAKSLLESEGVAVLMPDANAAMVLGYLSVSAEGWRLMVGDDDVAKAKAILGDAKLEP